MAECEGEGGECGCGFRGLREEVVVCCYLGVGLGRGKVSWLFKRISGGLVGRYLLSYGDGLMSVYGWGMLFWVGMALLACALLLSVSH